MSSTTQNTESVMSLIAMLKAATPEQRADVRDALDLGFPLHSEHLAAAVTPVKPAKTSKAPSAPQKPKKVKVAMALPEADGLGGVPEASDYRIDPSSIDDTVCIARITKGGEDKRWKPFVYRESQCGGKLMEGSDLCAKCAKREEKYNADPKPCDWTGRVGTNGEAEEPLDWVHMLGTAWAEGCVPKFSAGPSGASSVADAAEIASVEEMPVPVAKKPSAAAEKAAEKAVAAAAKAAAKAEAAAAKEAEKAAKAAAAAAKAAAKKEKEASKAKVKKEPKKPEAKVAVAAPVAAAEGDLKLIAGTLYMVKAGNVYEYDELAEKSGDFVGRLTADETIDTDAEEVVSAESDTD